MVALSPPQQELCLSEQVFVSPAWTETANTVKAMERISFFMVPYYYSFLCQYSRRKWSTPQSMAMDTANIERNHAGVRPGTETSLL